MENKIKIKTGSNISKLLQSTVNIPQAFTELIKNSIQNFATFTEIKLLEDSALIIDDGQGFDHEVDESGMNAFDKYFVFGNSYDTTGGQGLRLGQMGIGGKLSNDKLSHAVNIHWQIETKNKKGKCFIIDYKPSDIEFLDDYSPPIKEIDPSECSIKTESGTIIKIVNIKEDIKNNGWPIPAIKNELNTFFGFLIPELEKQGKKFQITINDNNLDFSYRLPGTNLPTINKQFKYIKNGTEQDANMQIRLSLVSDRSILANHPLKNIEIISNVKICSFFLSDIDLFNECVSELNFELNKDQISEMKSTFEKLIGFVSCTHLSSVLDDTGMPAKDLSHHGLRNDHPVTIPFYKELYKTIIKWLAEYVYLQKDTTEDEVDLLTSQLAELVLDDLGALEDLIDNPMKDFDPDENSDIELDEETEELKKELLEQKELEHSARQVLARQHEFDSDKDNPLPPKQNNFWKNYGKYKKPLKNIRYKLLNFGEGSENEMVKLDLSSKPTVLINNSNHKFNTWISEKNPLQLSLHISELFIRELTKYKEPLVESSVIDEKVSNFYLNKYKIIKEKTQ